MYPRLSFHTFKKNRKCLFCGEPIPDQAHKSRKFCPRKVLPDASVEDHKDDYHSARRKEEDAPFIKLGLYQKLMNKRIENLFKKTGEKVSVQQIQENEINLYRPIEFRPNNGSFTFYFFNYAIQLLNEKHAKIFKHGKQF